MLNSVMLSSRVKGMDLSLALLLFTNSCLPNINL